MSDSEQNSNQLPSPRPKGRNKKKWVAGLAILVTAIALAVGIPFYMRYRGTHVTTDMGKPITVAILDGASQIAVPAIVATLSICIVFFPVVLLVGPARFLFTPLALAVVLAMLASYLLSRTLVPTLSRLLIEHEHRHSPRPGLWSRVASRANQLRDRGFGRFLALYALMLQTVLAHRRFAMLAGGVFMSLSLVLAFLVGLDFFPSVDSGLMKLHFRAPVGTRIEETEQLVARLEHKIRDIVPVAELESMNAMIGIPVSYNLAFIQTDNIGPMDAEIRVSLKRHHRPTSKYMGVLAPEKW
jgi:multidrug efflux pump subunit AcrB